MHPDYFGVKFQERIAKMQERVEECRYRLTKQPHLGLTMPAEKYLADVSYLLTIMSPWMGILTNRLPGMVKHVRTNEDGSYRCTEYTFFVEEPPIGDPPVLVSHAWPVSKPHTMTFQEATHCDCGPYRHKPGCPNG